MHVLRRSLSLVLTLCCAAAAARAQSQILDLRAGGTTLDSESEQFVGLSSGLAVFVGRGSHGQEVWASDGTPAGTYLVKDLVVGGSEIRDLTACGPRALFTIDVSGIGRRLWVTDGTAAGTERPAELVVGNTNATPITLYDGSLYLQAYDAVSPSGYQLWKTNGTAAGTMVFDALSGQTAQGMTVEGGRLWYGKSGIADGLYVTDTSGGNVQHVPGSGSAPLQLIGAGGRVFYVASQTGTGQELHVSDGTAGGTGLVVEILAGTQQPGIAELTALGSNVVFTAIDATHGREIWVSDGTALGTQMLADINPVVSSTGPYLLRPSGACVFFLAYDPVEGQRLWKTDGTLGGTVPVFDPLPTSLGTGIAEMIAFNGGVLFSAPNANSSDSELWFSDGTTTSLVKDICPGTHASGPQNFRAVGSEVWFDARSTSGGPREVWKTDGTEMGTERVFMPQHTIGHSNPGELTAFAGGALFNADDGVIAGDRPWWTDGTTGNTFELADIGTTSSSYSSGFAQLGGCAYFLGTTSATGWEVFKTDGTTGGTGVAFELRAGAPGVSNFGNGPIVAANGKLYFHADAGNGNSAEPWASDGTLAGTEQLGDLRPGTQSSNASDFVGFGPYVYFRANPGPSTDYRLWRTNGTAAGTVEWLDVNATGDGNVRDLCVAGGKLFFAANATSSDAEVWVSDGTLGGTVSLDVWPGTAGSNPTKLTRIGNRLWFRASSSSSTDHLWASDGVTTVQVHELQGPSTNGFSTLHDLVDLNGQAFFVLETLDEGRELWTSDGTPGGTHLVVDLAPGPLDAIVPGTLVAHPAAGVVSFAATDFVDGLQVWVSDGSGPGTQRLGRFGTNPGVGAASIGEQLQLPSGELLCAANDGVGGVEPWTIPLGGITWTELPVPWSCAPDSQPRFHASGNLASDLASVTFAITDAPPGAPLAFWLGAPPSPFVPFDCSAIVVNFNSPVLSGLLADANGEFSFSFRGSPGLAAIPLQVQWLVFDGRFKFTNGMAWPP